MILYWGIFSKRSLPLRGLRVILVVTLNAESLKQKTPLRMRADDSAKKEE